MPAKLCWDQCCEMTGCLAPARYHGRCTAHWMGLTALERKVLTDCEPEQPTEEYEVGELLRMLATMATFSDDRPFKDAA